MAVEPSIGVMNTKIILQDMQLTVWDRSGKQGPGTYGAIAGAWCKKAAGAMAVYDGTDQQSFAALDPWLAELADYMKARGGNTELLRSFPILVVAAKADQQNKWRSVFNGRILISC